MRTCLGCRSKRPKDQLVRLVIGAHGELELDEAQRLPGRGAYVCPLADCLEKAAKGRRLAKALRSAGARLDTSKAPIITRQT